MNCSQARPSPGALDRNVGLLSSLRRDRHHTLDLENPSLLTKQRKLLGFRSQLRAWERRWLSTPFDPRFSLRSDQEMFCQRRPDCLGYKVHEWAAWTCRLDTQRRARAVRGQTSVYWPQLERLSGTTVTF